MAGVVQRIPIVLLTGFLGSGKTTLLRALLAHPAMANTAVLINELGEVGLDHHLVWSSGADATLVLENGCICCSISDDFISTLQDLFWKRLHRQIPHFDRVIVETTGIADPGPIVHFLAADALVAERYRIESVVTTVDASCAEVQLDAHWESVRQVASADVLVLTKTDLAHLGAEQQLAKRLRQLNPTARLERAAQGRINPEQLFGSTPRLRVEANPAGLALVPPQRQPLRLLTPASDGPGALRSWHDSRIRCFSLAVSAPIARAVLEQGLRAVLARFDNRMLRVKGLVRVEEEEFPLVVQAAGATLFALESLGCAMPEHGRYGLVFITDGLERQELLIEAAAFLSIC